jgi:hypothetical protein
MVERSLQPSQRLLWRREGFSLFVGTSTILNNLNVWSKGVTLPGNERDDEI